MILFSRYDILNIMSTIKIDNLLKVVGVKLSEWLKGNPTGSFSVTLSANQGGLRGDPEIGIKEKLK